uniref:Adenylosuccinate lyase n=1 Tax=Chromera velia CCMP2878 TaxID=1169474 RepID=A0A0G4GCP4_9ALVE|mmetsp:Transcript_36327/g.71488  ORF Transcript_36327/g.71488 Transcript_36327/m.71488 type:complete len:473 (+) Transcript_36327:163-1581(+)|eukprot:Cvel_4514.t1-p1 / transcript=Cvel_4514.t1 / gene=Cvel_4514 / organism=Chromera_velia_CCMP2878 / gene_product=Adenylosuccinate lyase, putative / transcript_product=Adenylosuccinate lyase, putative / location=Cvel_scaffold197:94253-101337(+) / protein_length=472 / sequence_SO=supercontig / SO=protein_coding / is_pseudo=false
MALPLSSLTAVSPVDGRYGSKAAPLRAVFSEYGLIKYRVRVECEWMRVMAACDQLPEVLPLNEKEDALLTALCNIPVESAQRVKDIEATTNHDVKAIEYFIKEEFAKKEKEGCERLHKCREYVHFSCTSEDINNLSYALMVKDGVACLIPAMTKLVDTLVNLAKEHAKTPLLSRTHGQAASPTTFGKEMANFAYRFQNAIADIQRVKFMGKFNGAVGNFNAHLAAYPEIDWPALASKLVQGRLGLVYQPYSTQIEQHDYVAEICDALARFLTILIDFDVDMWLYISRDLLKLRPVEGEIGSSTMPHKVNPIDFENSEGNAGVANALLKFFSGKLPISRLQRDLTDSTVLRNQGTAFGHALLAVESSLKGLSKIAVNEAAMLQELDRNWAVLAEPVQTVLRRAGAANPYETLKALTRGREVDQSKMAEFVKSLEGQLGPKEIQRLLELSPASYTGIATQLALEVEGVIAKIRS